MRWTDEEINMLYSNMSNHEIAQKTGRAVGTVMRMRRYHTGYTKPCPLPNGRERISKKEGEARIIRLANKLGIKIEGVR